MAAVTTSKPINLYQFALELDAPFRTLRRGDELTIRADVDQATLDAAVEAHVADDSIQPPASPPPLVDPAEFPPEDERVATDALLTEDSVGYRAVIELLIGKGIITAEEVAAVQAVALRRLVTLADNPDVRRQMIAGRIARAEQARR